MEKLNRKVAAQIIIKSITQKETLETCEMSQLGDLMDLAKYEE